MARILILFGVVLILVGLLWGPLTRMGLGRLPGDIVIRREGFTLYLPLASGLVISVVLSVAIAIVRAFLGR